MSALSLKTVAVVGAGTMGSGIAQWFAQQGVRVELLDTKLALALDAHKKVVMSWEKLAEKGKFSAQEIEQFQENLLALETGQMSPAPDLLIEAIIENHDIKLQVLRELDQRLDEKTVMATNTSSLSVKALGLGLSKERQSRFLGLHFFNPATIMKLVEVITTDETAPELVQELQAWFKAHQKVPALSQDSPGFIVNRVARNFYGEPMRIVGPHPAQSDLREVDQVLKEVGGFAMGPFELMDLIGLDVNYQVSQSVWEAFHQEPRFQPHRLQAGLVRAGLMGRKTKRGFYQYE